MDSVKSIVVVAILLGVLYGIYQVINDDDSPVSPNSTNLLADFDSESKEKKSDEVKTDGTEQQDIDSSMSMESDASPMSVNLDPPPSTFDPGSSSFVYPKKNEDSPSKTVDFLSNGSNLSSERGSAGSPTESNRANPASDWASKSPAANGFEQHLNSEQNIYQPSDRVEDSTRETQTSGVAEFKDPRKRFVSGSFTDFEKQVRGDMDLAEDMIRKSDFVGALKLLTKFYDDPRLTTEENQNLVSWLDPLAGKVVYSVEHHLLEPYYVRQNDTLNLLSIKFGVPPELIFNINRVAIPDQTKLVPGTELKMLRGPFNAEISLTKSKMTFFVKGMYAGTFKIRIGNEPRPKTGEYRVLTKSRLGQDYNDKNDQTIEALDPRNPYGKYYLNLGGRMALHGSAQVSDSQDTRGCISLNAVDAEDVHNILTTESVITIVD